MNLLKACFWVINSSVPFNISRLIPANAEAEATIGCPNNIAAIDAVPNVHIFLEFAKNEIIDFFLLKPYSFTTLL